MQGIDDDDGDDDGDDEVDAVENSSEVKPKAVRSWTAESVPGC